MIKLYAKRRCFGLVFDKNIVAYYLLMNFAAFIAFFADKKFAVEKRKRIPEDILIGLSFIGGAAGGFLSMMIFRHKTRKLKFRLLLPLFIFLHIAFWLCFGGKI